MTRFHAERRFEIAVPNRPVATIWIAWPPRMKPQSSSVSARAVPRTRRTKSQMVNSKCSPIDAPRGDTNALRTPAEQRRCGDNSLHVPLSNREQRRKTSLQRCGAGTHHSGRYDILSAKLADDRIHGARWSSRQIRRRPDNQAGRAWISGARLIDRVIRSMNFSAEKKQQTPTFHHA